MVVLTIILVADNLFLHHWNRVDQCYAVVHCIRIAVRSSVVKCYREQKARPKSTHFGTYIGMLTKQVRIPIFSLTINVLELYFTRQMFGYEIFSNYCITKEMFGVHFYLNVANVRYASKACKIVYHFDL